MTWRFADLLWNVADGKLSPGWFKTPRQDYDHGGLFFETCFAKS